MHDILVKAAIIIFLVIPLIGMTAAFFISAMCMQIKDDIKQAEVKANEACNAGCRVSRRAQAAGRA